MALAFHQMDSENAISVDIYEAAAELTQIGVGITLSPRAWEVFDKLGLSEPKSRMLPGNDQNSGVAFNLRKSDQLEGFELGCLSSKGKLPSLSQGF